MDLICVLFFDPKGNLEDGYGLVTVRIEDSNGKKWFQGRGQLPCRPDIAKSREKWSSTMLQAARSLRVNSRNSPLRAIQAGENSYTSSEYKAIIDELLDRLECQINLWFKEETFSIIRDAIVHFSARAEHFRFIIETEDIELQRLPWNLWECSKQQIKRIPASEIAISSTQYKKLDLPNNFQRKKVRILCILGDSSGIDITEDRKILEQTINADVKFIVEPSRETLLQEITDSQGWDILFFAGHSISQQDGQNGDLFINQNERLKVSELKGVLSDAITRGLTLAIFNSCDGIGIANKLVSLDIPHTIVMREPVPDIVAQEFFKALITEFSHNQKSLSQAIAKARQHLVNHLEHQCPGASSLPLLFNNASYQTLTWNNFPAIENHARIMQLEQSQSKITPHDPNYINIAFIGDCTSGKTTYIASLIRNPNPSTSSIINKIDALDHNARQLIDWVRKRIEKGESLKQNNPAEIAKIIDYRLAMMLQRPYSLWKDIFGSAYKWEEFKFNLRDYDGQFFDSLDRIEGESNCSIQNHPQSWTQSTGILLAIAITENRKDLEYEQKIDRLLSILDSDRSAHKCQRIAVVLTKCDRPEVFSSYKSLTPQKLAEKYFLRVYNKLQKWGEISPRELSYFSTSAFGFSDTHKSKANVQNNSGKDVLERVECWRPVNLLDPIYWLATGKRHPESDNSS